MTTTHPTRQDTALDKRRDVATWIQSDRVREQLSLAASRHLKPDRLLRIALTTIMRTPKLQDCTRESIINALLTCSHTGLEPDGYHAHLIPYGNVCQLIIDYKGLVAIGSRDGVKGISVDVLCENDEWSRSRENGALRIHHKVNDKEDRGKPIAYYSTAIVDGEFNFCILNMEQIEKRRRSRKGCADKNLSDEVGPWRDWYEEMCKKTVLRHHSKMWPRSIEAQTAASHDDQEFKAEVTVHDRPRFDSNFLGPSTTTEQIEEPRKEDNESKPQPAAGLSVQQPDPPPERPPDDDAKLAEAGLAPAQAKPRTRHQEYEANALVRDRVQGWMLNNSLRFEDIMAVAGQEGLVKNADSYGDMSQVPVAALRVIWDAKEGILAAVKAMAPKAEAPPKGMLI